jgi:hypothetical protein
MLVKGKQFLFLTRITPNIRWWTQMLVKGKQCIYLWYPTHFPWFNEQRVRKQRNSYFYSSIKSHIFFPLSREYKVTNLGDLNLGFNFMKYKLKFYGWRRPNCWCLTPREDSNHEIVDSVVLVEVDLPMLVVDMIVEVGDDVLA